MSRWWELLPPKASSFADEVDTIYGALCGMAAFFVVLIGSLILIFAVKYRRSRRLETPAKTTANLALEIGWCLLPLCVGLVFFAWGAKSYLGMAANAPSDAYTIYVTAKQWMWKFQHVTGQREINELHLPVGKAVRLLMISQDVIHSFYVPAFRVKHDLLPMKYTQVWFQPTVEGSYPLFCAEYCGTSHSGMIGRVVVMKPGEFEHWLAGAQTQGAPASDGESLLASLGCRACHLASGTSIGPRLEGIFGRKVLLEGGAEAVVDENYLRESILNPAAKVVAGYQAVMPPYVGRINEEELAAIIAYIRAKRGEP